MIQFTRAEKRRAKLRLALSGPSGSGKTYSALAIGKHLGERMAVIDTENGSASLYADRFRFDVLELAPPYDPLRYVEAIEAAEAAGYDVLVIDSLSHEWSGKGGCLEMVDMAAKRYGGNKHYAWAEVTPKHNALVERINRAKMHVIATMRSKTTWAEETDERGRKNVKRLGLAPVQRDGMEYEFTVHAEMDHEHHLIVTKSRCAALQDQVIRLPGEQVAKTLREWLERGADEVEPPADETTPLRKRIEELAGELAREELSDVERSHVHKALELAGDTRAQADRLERAAEFLESMIAMRQDDSEVVA